MTSQKITLVVTVTANRLQKIIYVSLMI